MRAELSPEAARRLMLRADLTDAARALADGVFITFLDGLFGFDAKTGKLLWQNAKIKYNVASLLGTTRRSNGSLQVTYNKHPLYMFLRDKLAGQTNGEGSLAFGARWYAVSAKGLAVLKAPPATTTGYTTSTSTGYTTTGYSYGGGG